MTAMATVYRDRRGQWMLAFCRDSVVDYVPLHRVLGQPIGTATRATVVARAWLDTCGVYELRCPRCGAGFGARCRRRVRVPHAARVNRIGDLRTCE